MPEPYQFVNSLPPAYARAALTRCCGSERWVSAMMAQRPFASTDAMLSAACDEWRALSEEDLLEAFSHHPKIGEDPDGLARRFAATATLSEGEQAGVRAASAETLRALQEANLQYDRRFGFVFLVCATGKSADAMLSLLQERLEHDRPTELRIAAREHEKITRLRLLGLAP